RLKINTLPVLISTGCTKSQLPCLRGCSRITGGYIQLKFGACVGETGTNLVVLSNLKNLNFKIFKFPDAFCYRNRQVVCYKARFSGVCNERTTSISGS